MATFILSIAAPVVAHAVPANDFNVQVAPSPLAITLTPGQSQTSSLTVRNFSNHSETLQPTLKGFSIDDASQKIALNDNVPASMQSWVHFKQPTLTLAAGASAPLDVVFDTPSNVGFSYSLAIVLKRASASTPLSQVGTQLQPQIAIFCLVNINRPDATSQLTLPSIRSAKSRYSFLPASFVLTIANQGNVIAEPSGTLFIQRSFDSPAPIVGIPINPGHGYVLPGTRRDFTTTWTDGFPVYITKTVNGRPSVHLHWDWRHISELRVGRYVAKAVLVYSDGRRDVPIMASTTFWVIPWWLLICSFLVLIVLIMGVVGWGWLIFKGTKKVKGYAHPRKK
ncbi:MAG TPA: hypothetical protein VJP80_02660 [Candidatus Saccharimonadales bacterium]|nr:hypothetical protein [Candidatus Saccharimonadales bacterium]